MRSAQEILDSFNKLNVLVVGDVMVDSYWCGNVTRISPEAPVPVVHVQTIENRLGGAANVALNVHALGAVPIVCSVTGDDEPAFTVVRLLEEKGLSGEGILRTRGRSTTVKTRVIGNKHQMLRIDAETEKDISSDEESELLARISAVISKENIHVAIIEDYNKGCITHSLLQKLLPLLRQAGIPVAVDPKKKNFLSFPGVTLFKPNLKELREGLKLDFETDDLNELKNAAETLRDRLQSQKVLLTLSEKGVLISTEKGATHVPAHVRNIADVSGAGDTVITVASLALAAGCSDREIAELANLAGGIVCEYVGVVPIDRGKLLIEANELFSRG